VHLALTFCRGAAPEEQILNHWCRCSSTVHANILRKTTKGACEAAALLLLPPPLGTGGVAHSSAIPASASGQAGAPEGLDTARFS
jgi:hypothetical protein